MPAPTAVVPGDPALRGAVALLGLASFFSGAALRICDGLLPRLARDFGTTTGTAGQVVLTFSVAGRPARRRTVRGCGGGLAWRLREPRRRLRGAGGAAAVAPAGG